MSNSFARKIKRNQLRALVIAQARAGGCTCEPAVTLPPGLPVPGKVRVVTIAHDNDRPHYVEAPGAGALVASINSGAFDER